MNQFSINLKIIFLGNPEFASIILEGLVKQKYKPILVITAPDKPAGRKKTITPPPVKITAQKYNILAEQPEKIENCKLKIENLKPDIIISAAYGQIIPEKILKIPKYGSLNVHPSLLPKYRGPSPIQTTILNGDEKTGVTIYLMDEKIDHGPILAKKELKIPNPNDQCPLKSQTPMTKITYECLNKILAETGSKLLIETIPKYVKGEIKARPQNYKLASYTKIFKKEDGEINWKKSANEIERQIRAFYPWPGTFTFFKKGDKKLRVKILKANVSKKEIPEKLSVKCKKDYLIIEKLQPEGKKEISGEEFLRGYKNFVIQ